MEDWFDTVFANVVLGKGLWSAWKAGAIVEGGNCVFGRLAVIKDIFSVLDAEIDCIDEFAFIEDEEVSVMSSSLILPSLTTTCLPLLRRLST
jgi:hypothetical protein